MKGLYEYYKNPVSEARTKETGIADDGRVVVDGTVKKMDDKQLDKLSGKSEDNNGSKGAWAIEAPTDDSPMKGLSKADITRNEKSLIRAMKDTKYNGFFIQGHAGWGKTSIVEKVANHFKRSVITVYLDKAEATDLDGIPVPVKENGRTVMNVIPPAWAQYMIDHPEEKFLLFFDEFNQAQPDVMNAIMPIVQKKAICGQILNNFIVGAAGNFDEENSGVNPIDNKALQQRLQKIAWYDGDDESWRESFQYLHKAWDDKLGKDVVDLFDNPDVYNMFASPRLMDQKLLQTLYDWKQEQPEDPDDIEYMDQTDVLSLLEQEIKLKEGMEDAMDKRAIRNIINTLADNLYNKVLVKNGKKEEKKMTSRRSKGTMTAEDKKNLIGMLKSGKVKIDGEYYPVTREDIMNSIGTFWGDKYNAEIVNQAIEDQLQKEPDFIMFNTNKDLDNWEKKNGRDFC